MEIFGMKVVISDNGPHDKIVFCRPIDSPIQAQAANDRIVFDKIGGRLVGVELVGGIINIR